MLTLIVIVVGAVAGFVLGGFWGMVIGALIGWFLGGLIESADVQSWNSERAQRMREREREGQ